MRELTSHKTNPVNDLLNIYVIDSPGSGGANHCYDVTGLPAHSLTLEFQNGPIGEAGVNGITHEVLLAIVIDRLECFQAGPFASPYNAAALEHLRSALGALLDRTRDRMAKGIEGTLQFPAA